MYGLGDRGVVAAGYRAVRNILDIENLNIDERRLVCDLPADGPRLVRRLRGHRAINCGGEVTSRRMGQPGRCRAACSEGLARDRPSDPAVSWAMTSTALPRDTSPEIWAVMVERWRSMSAAEKGELVDAMCRDCDELAWLGIASLEPLATEARRQWLMMMRRYGRRFATSVLGPEPPRSS